MAIRVLIAEQISEPISRLGLRLLLERMVAIEVCGDVGGRDEVCAALTETRPDILLFCLHRATPAESNLLSEVLDIDDSLLVVILTDIDDAPVLQRMVGLGVVGIVQRSSTPELLQRAIERVHAGELWTDRTLAAGVVRSLARQRKTESSDALESIARLSDREREVIALVGEGLKNQAIAERLFVSEAAVRHRLTSIFEKLPVDDRMALVIFAYRYGLATLPR